ncbi:MAG: hypothetical protein OXG82_04305 [Gammaproteobacteria bacterium]|nr:hypothetical protein [Gammaproteobacteria bacterium]
MTAVASFYVFRPLNDLDALRNSLDEACAAERLKGTVLLAREGVNAALAGRRPGIERVVAAYFPEADVKWSTADADNPVFDRLKVRLKPEIVTFGLELSPATRVGAHVDAATWDRLLSDPTVTVLDVRNGYESDIGTFRGARCTDTGTFGEFRDFVARELDPGQDRRLALFCTGGIRCEKASAYLIERGFEDVCQLGGGILGYLAEMGADSAFEGECFVFDQRVSVTGRLARGHHALCDRCGRAIPSDVPRSVACPACRGCTASGGGQAERLNPRL